MILSLEHDLWIQLLVIGVVLVFAEAVVPGFVILPLGLGLILTAGVAAVTTNWYVLVPVAGALQFLSYYLTRKYMKKALDAPKKKTTAEGMIGKEATVTEPIEPGSSGYIKLYGDLWMARSFNERVLTVGTKVTITKIDGNKVWVTPLNED